jgi:hypothetical protein
MTFATTLGGVKARYLALAAGAVIAAVVGGIAGPAGASAASGGAVLAGAASGGAASAAHVVVVGIPGLRWSDVSAATSPALYRIADQGSVGTLVEYAVKPHTCPADGWLTLNAGARAGVDHAESGPCPALPAVNLASGTVSGMNGIVNYNNTLGYSPQWGMLASGAGTGCSLAVGPGAALALADEHGRVDEYRPGAGGLTAAALARCPLTVVDLGALPAGPATARAAAVRTADTELGAIDGELPPDTILLVTSPGALDKAQLGVVVVDGPGYRDGQLNARSTRQPGMVVSTDLTPSVLGWLGQPQATSVTSGARGSLDAAIRDFTGQETAEEVWTTSHSPFFWAYALADAGVLAAIGLIFWGATEQRRRKRARGWRMAGLFAAALPAGTFLANLVPWSQLAYPAAWLYGVSIVFGAVIGLAALAGARWFRGDPLAPFGLVCLFTVLVLGVDVMTGSRLQLETPFGLSVLEAGRFYGIGNEALGIYGIAALAGAGWLASLLLPRGRRAALIAVSVVAVFTVFASGWPGFGGKAGGTISIVPCFLVLLLLVGGMRLTWRRALAIAVSGLVVLAVLALINYLVPATGNSDIGTFAGNVVHGRSAGGDLLLRKIHSNIGSLKVNAFSPLIPVVLVLSALMLWRPSWFSVRTVPLAFAAEPLLPVILGVMWLMGVLGWFANDSGVIVPAAAMPFALPLAIAMLAATAYRQDKARYPDTAVAGPPSVAGQPV